MAIEMSRPASGRFTYRREIDGLRAIAVIAVVIFHLDHQWLPGGFVGVDVFFVISGYLITNLILGDLECNRFSLVEFYQRRVARIFPTFALVAVMTTAFAALVYLPLDFASTGANLSAAMLSVINFKYVTQGTYFEISPDAQPFLHYWSLSVEEQFYIVFPVIMVLLAKTKRLTPTYVGIILLASLALCIILTRISPTAAFYLLPTRAWELLAGGLLAFFQAGQAGRWKEKIAAVPVPLSLVTILGSILFINESSGFPGYIALVPVLGTVAILARTGPLDGICSRILASGPLVQVGKLSYSLYLWHWPIFSLVDYRFFQKDALYRLGLKLALTSIATVVTYAAWESPARKALRRRDLRVTTYSLFILTTLLCVGLGIYIRKSNYLNVTSGQIASGGIAYRQQNPSGSVVLMGDSNASMYGASIRDICDDIKCDLNVLSISAGDPLPNFAGDSNQQWSDSVAAVRRLRPDVLVMAYAWSSKLKEHPERLDKAIKIIAPFVRSIVILNQPPTLPLNANRSAIRAGSPIAFREEPVIKRQRKGVNSRLLKVAATRIHVVDVASMFETNAGGIVFLDAQGRQMFQDATHISGFGALAVQNKIKLAIATQLNDLKQSRPMVR